MKYLYARGGLPGALVTTMTATGGTPTVSTTGVEAGDLCVWGISCQDTIPPAAGPQGGGWSPLWRIDAGSNEWAAAYYKFSAGGEPGTWTWTMTSGTQSGNSVAIYRGPTRLVDAQYYEGDFTGEDYMAIPDRRTAGARAGLLVGFVHATLNGGTITSPTVYDVYNTTRDMMILSRNIKYPESAGGRIMVTGTFNEAATLAGYGFFVR